MPPPPTVGSTGADAPATAAAKPAAGLLTGQGDHIPHPTKLTLDIWSDTAGLLRILQLVDASTS